MTQLSRIGDTQLVQMEMMKLNSSSSLLHTWLQEEMCGGEEGLTLRNAW